jgi:hypothetical protein
MAVSYCIQIKVSQGDAKSVSVRIDTGEEALAPMIVSLRVLVRRDGQLPVIDRER